MNLLLKVIHNLLNRFFVINYFTKCDKKITKRLQVKFLSNNPLNRKICNNI